MLNFWGVLVATMKRIFAALWVWALRHEVISSSILALLMGLIIGGAATVIDFFLVT